VADGGGDGTSAPDHGGSTDTNGEPGKLGEWPPPTELGSERIVPVQVPADYDATSALPLVLLLGGYDYASADLDAWIAVSGRVDADQFILALPDGLVDSWGSPYWNATDTCCDYDGTGVDDSGFLEAVIDEATLRLAVDPDRVWLIGHSAGGFMAYRMACDLGERIDAVVSLAGSGFLDASKCETSDAVRVLQVHGSEDDVMPYGGDSEAPGAEEMLQRWAVRAGCAGAGLNPLPNPAPIVTNAELTSGFGYGPTCTASIELWRVEGADHYPDFAPSFAGTILAWLGSAE